MFTVTSKRASVTPKPAAPTLTASVRTPSPADDAITDHRPYAMVGFAAIGIVLGSLGLWSVLAPLRAAAIAPARIAVEGDRKPVQHLEGGIIEAILVKEAERVERGQVLFRIDTTKARANAESLREQRDAELALEARLTAEHAGLDAFAVPARLQAYAHWPDVTTALADQRRILNEHRRTLELETAGLDARIRQAREDIAARESRLAGTRQQLAKKSLLAGRGRVVHSEAGGCGPCGRSPASPAGGSRALPIPGSDLGATANTLPRTRWRR
jgi:multidrug efflux pump subunit AcrA (membrane-fusion protein)